MPERNEARLARVEEALLGVKEDTTYLRESLDAFKELYWRELLKTTGKVAGLSTIVSLIVGSVTVVIARAIWP